MKCLKCSTFGLHPGVDKYTLRYSCLSVSLSLCPRLQISPEIHLSIGIIKATATSLLQHHHTKRTPSNSFPLQIPLPSMNTNPTLKWKDTISQLSVSQAPATWNKQLIQLLYAHNSTCLSPLWCMSSYESSTFPWRGKEVLVPATGVLVQHCHLTWRGSPDCTTLDS